MSQETLHPEHPPEHQEEEKQIPSPGTGELEIDNLPNRITIFRVLLIPIILFCLYLQMPLFDWSPLNRASLGWIAAWTFVLASITDFFDGYIARKRNIVTIFGSFLDPIADKFLTVSALIMLQALGRVDAIIVIILVLREIYMTSLRLLASTEGLKVPVSQLGKWKTATQMIGLPMLMANANWWYFPLPILGKILVYMASFLSLYSSINYSIGLIKKIKLLRLEKKRRKKIRKGEAPPL